MNICVFIQAREGSTRFPGKISADLCGKTVLARVCEQAAQIKGVNGGVFVLMPQDYPNREENDVLGRYADAARKYGADVIVRVTGDCPLFDPQVGTHVLKRFLSRGRLFEYVSNIWPKRTWPDGMDCEVFTADILQAADLKATRPEDREHVTPWIQRNADGWYNLRLPVDWSHVRLTVDTPEDLEWLRHAITSPRS